MKVLVILACLFGFSLAADYETDVYDTIERWWTLMPKADGENVTFFDFVDFFKLYDTDYDNVTDEGIFEVTENEFADAWGKQLNVSEDAARAYFKRMDISRFFVGFLPERISETDCLLFIDQLDLDGNGYLDEFEFTGQFSWWFTDLPWGVMFIRYRSDLNIDPDFGYDDAITNDFTETGDWQKIFDAMDTDADEFVSVNEMAAFFAAGDYGSENFARDFHAEADVSNDGFIEKRFEWGYMFTRLDRHQSGNFLTYSEFTCIDWLVRPIVGDPSACLFRRSMRLT